MTTKAKKTVAKKKPAAKKERHHPAYDPTLEAGTVTLTLQQAEGAVCAIAEGLRAGRLHPLLAQRAVVAVDALDAVFGLGIREKKKGKKK